MTAHLRGDKVLVDDPKEASTLQNKGWFGKPLSGGSLELTLVEAAYLAAENRLKVQDHDAAALVAEGARREAGFEALFLVHRELRGRGLVARRHDGAAFLAWPRGSTPGRDKADVHVLVASERAPFAPARLLADARAAAEAGRRLLVALVDEEADITFYAVDPYDPRGAAPEPKEAPPVPATLLSDRVLVVGPAPHLREAGYGRDVGAGLQLPHVEALHLARLGRLAVDASAVERAARARDPDFDLKARVWRDLRARGLLVRTGLKFGTHFRAYKRAADTEHAPYLVHAIPADAVESAPKIAGFVRLAHAVRKTLLLALVDGDAVAYVALERTRP